MKASLRSPLSVLGFAVLALLATSCSTTDKAAPSQADNMARMMELAKPGPEHADLARHAGTWEVTIRHRMGPVDQWQETIGTTNATTELGGRYLREVNRFEFAGMPFEGVHLIGYDNQAQEYISMWMDTMSTWWVTSRGKKQADGSIDLRGTMIDPIGERDFRMVLKEGADGTLHSEMYDTVPGQGEFLAMTTVARRK